MAPREGDAAAEEDAWLCAEGVYLLRDGARAPPCAVVWTSLPPVTWLLPVIGHVGVTTSGGVVTDFSGPYQVTVGSLMCGPARRVWVLEDVPADGYDEAVQGAACAFGKQMHGLVTNNCHSHVAQALNNMRYGGRQDWNMFRVWLGIVRHGRWVSTAAAVQTLGPFVVLVVIVVLGSTLGTQLR